MQDPIPMLLWCPACHRRHYDEGEFAQRHHHHTHACQSCGVVWRPALVPTVGVRFLPGFRNESVMVAEEKLLSACRAAMIVTGAPEEFMAETSERAIREAIIELRGVEREFGLQGVDIGRGRGVEPAGSTE